MPSRVEFHPSKPYFYVATQRYVRVYDLQKQALKQKLMTGVQHVSSLSVHPGGDNVICGSYDKRFCWFDTDLSTKPYRVLRSHTKAVRSVSFHRAYPLCASASDDGMVHVYHSMVYDDLMTNPLIVPVKVRLLSTRETDRDRQRERGILAPHSAEATAFDSPQCSCDVTMLCQVLKGHTITGGLGVLHCVFHPTQPWIFTAGADGRIHLYTNVHK